MNAIEYMNALEWCKNETGSRPKPHTNVLVFMPEANTETVWLGYLTNEKLGVAWRDAATADPFPFHVEHWAFIPRPPIS